MNLQYEYQNRFLPSEVDSSEARSRLNRQMRAQGFVRLFVPR